MDKLYFTIKEVSEILGVSPLTLRNWDKNGKLEARRHPMNNYRVYKKEDIEKLIDEIESGAELRKSTKRMFKKVKIKHIGEEQ